MRKLENWIVNHKRNLPINMEEVTVLESIQRLGNGHNEIIDETNKVKNTLEVKEDKTNITNKRKLSNEGVFTGKWFDVEKPTKADETTGAVVDLHDKKLKPTYENIETIKSRDSISNTQYWLTIIKPFDVDGTPLKLNRGFAKDSVDGCAVETGRAYSRRKGSSFCMNGGIFQPSTNKIVGTSIKDGVIIQEDKTIWNKFVMAWDDNLRFKCYRSNEGADVILKDGFKNALVGFIPLVIDGEEVEQVIKDLYVPFLERHPRHIIGKMKNGNIVFLSTSGRKTDNEGFTCQDCIRVLQRYDIEFAYMLDGGGSTQQIINGVMINDRYDGGGYTERPVTDFIHFEKEIADINPNLSDLRQNYELGSLDRQIKDLVLDILNNTDILQGYLRLKSKEGDNFQGVESWTGEVKNTKLSLNKDYLSYFDYLLNRTVFKVDNVTGAITTNVGQRSGYMNFTKLYTDLNLVTETCNAWCNTNTLNLPTLNGIKVVCLIQNFVIDSQTSLQIGTPFNNSTNNKTFRRRKVANVWQEWIMVE